MDSPAAGRDHRTAAARQSPEGEGSPSRDRPFGFYAEAPPIPKVLAHQIHESVSAAAAAAPRERGLPVREQSQDRRDCRAGMQAKVSCNAISTASFPRMVSKVLPHDALSQVRVHYWAV
jgi:hypothetical protein